MNTVPPAPEGRHDAIQPRDLVNNALYRYTTAGREELKKHLAYRTFPPGSAGARLKELLDQWCDLYATAGTNQQHDYYFKLYQPLWIGLSSFLDVHREKLIAMPVSRQFQQFINILYTINPEEYAGKSPNDWFLHVSEIYARCVPRT